MGGPLTNWVTVADQGRTLTFDYQLQGAGGRYRLAGRWTAASRHRWPSIRRQRSPALASSSSAEVALVRTHGEYLPTVSAGELKIKAHGRPGALGATTGPEIAYQWSPPSRLPRFLPALALLLLLLRSSTLLAGLVDCNAWLQSRPRVFALAVSGIGSIRRKGYSNL